MTIATVYEPSAVAAVNDAAGGDAGPEEAAEVPSKEGSAEADEQNQETQAEEIRPGGKKEFEDTEQRRNSEKK